MNIHVNVHSSFKAILPAQWDRLAVSRSIYQDLQWYENAPLPGRLRLITASTEGELCAILPLFIVTEPSHYYHSPRANCFAAFVSNYCSSLTPVKIAHSKRLWQRAGFQQPFPSVRMVIVAA